MRCPVCLERLKKLPKGVRYETLSQHVSNPNATPPLRPAYRCPNGCHKGIYGYDGALYGGYNEPKEKRAAVNSFQWQLENWDFWYGIWIKRQWELLKIYRDFMDMVEEVIQ